MTFSDKQTDGEKGIENEGESETVILPSDERTLKDEIIKKKTDRQKSAFPKRKHPRHPYIYIYILFILYTQTESLIFVLH
jgi:hypothetical protein